MAPADVQKEGPAFDLPIALGILHNTKQVVCDSEALYVGELSLDGRIRPVRGVISICQLGVKLGCKRIFVPTANAFEASLIHGIEVVGVGHLLDVVDILNGKNPDSIVEKKGVLHQREWPDFADVRGQVAGKRALEIAAAGGHNVLFVGPPGSGKTMLLQRLPSILPDLGHEEAIETLKLLSMSRKHHSEEMSLDRPFRNPHHTISYPALVGGGQCPLPGEISLAHHGILFLDELAEFPRHLLEALRQPLEEKKVVISRAQYRVEYPANFMLVASMNPCSCGYFNDKAVSCRCQAAQVQKYWKKVSGPILDRIDMVLEIPRLKKEDFLDVNEDVSQNPFVSQSMKYRVLEARKKQSDRHGHSGVNAHLSVREMRRYCRVDEASKNVLAAAVEKGMLSGRSHDKILKIARTIADLEGVEVIGRHHVTEAIQYRKGGANLGHLSGVKKEEG